MSDSPVPANERQAKALRGLPADEAAQVMRDTAQRGPVTARSIRETRTEREEPTPQRSPIADAVAAARTSPRIVGGKAIERFRLARKTVEACGGPAAIVADSDDFDAIGPLWLEEIEQALACLNDLRAALRRRQIRSIG